MAGLILPATQAHVPALTAIHAASFSAREQWGTDTISLQLGLPGGFGLMHLGGGMVLARVMADESEILTLAVMPERRRDGLGRALLLAAMAWATEQGARAMFLEVAVANLAAQALYRQAGFIEVGRRPNYYPDGGDALVMRADLPSPTS
jgi:ribosomal-protein-alanine N-acetyltransferase